MKKAIALLTVIFTITVTSTTIGFAESKGPTPAQTLQSATIEQPKDSTYYTCPMHPEVKLDKPGNCPKCGMKLEKKTVKASSSKSQKKNTAKEYTCSMCGGSFDKPGACPKCGMDLKEKKK